MRQHDVSKFSLSMKDPAAVRIVATHDLAARMRPLPTPEANQTKPGLTLVMAPPGAGKTFLARKLAEDVIERSKADDQEALNPNSLRRPHPRLVLGEARDVESLSRMMADHEVALVGHAQTTTISQGDALDGLHAFSEEAASVLANCNVRVFPSQKT